MRSGFLVAFGRSVRKYYEKERKGSVAQNLNKVASTGVSKTNTVPVHTVDIMSQDPYLCLSFFQITGRTWI
jgi:hypothetical protein